MKQTLFVELEMSLAHWAILLLVFAICAVRLASATINERTILGSRAFNLHSHPRIFWCVTAVEVVGLVLSVGLMAKAAV